MQLTCIAKECNNKGKMRRGYCNKHYLRLKKYNDLELPVRANAKKHPLYIRWKNMRTRCNNINSVKYDDWGGRGITICKEWSDFWIYAKDIQALENYLTAGYTLDRIDNNKGYEPYNMRWATNSTQSLNQRMRKDNTSGYKNIYKTPNGSYKTLIYRNKTKLVDKTFKTIGEALKCRSDYL